MDSSYLCLILGKVLEAWPPRMSHWTGEMAGEKKQEPCHPSSKILDDFGWFFLSQFGAVLRWIEDVLRWIKVERSVLPPMWSGGYGGLPAWVVCNWCCLPHTCHTAHILLPPELIPKNPNHLMEEIQNNHLGIFQNPVNNGRLQRPTSLNCWVYGISEASTVPHGIQKTLRLPINHRPFIGIGRFGIYLGCGPFPGFQWQIKV